ncbi:MAG: hypothetical protein M0Z52_03950 [Actinomycetota bacterium]|nr:hypothetical protein [Actinomycetota bacterium]
MKKDNPYVCDECSREVKKGGYYMRRQIACLETDGLVTLMIVPAIPAFNPEDYDNHLCCRNCLTTHIDGIAAKLTEKKVAA